VTLIVKTLNREICTRTLTLYSDQRRDNECSYRAFYSYVLIGPILHAAAVTQLEIRFIVMGYAVAQLVEALRYKPEGRGFDSRLL
jgi:hypothetical protein